MTALPIIGDDGRAYIDAGSSGAYGWHAHGSAAQCWQLWAYEQRLKLVPAADNRVALVRGSMLHSGLAHFYGQALGIENLAPIDAAVTRTAGALGGGADLIATVQGALDIYQRDHAAELDGAKIRIVAVEQVLEATINGQRYTQRADLIIEAGGAIAIIDHKGVGFIETKTSRAHTLNGQMVGYKWLGQREFGKAFHGVYLNLVQLGKEYRVQRRKVEPAPAAVKQFPDRIQDIQEARERLSTRNPWEYPKALSEVVCYHRYGVCPYMPLCQYGEKALHLYVIRED